MATEWRKNHRPRSWFREQGDFLLRVEERSAHGGKFWSVRISLGAISHKLGDIHSTITMDSTVPFDSREKPQKIAEALLDHLGDQLKAMRDSKEMDDLRNRLNAL